MQFLRLAVQKLKFHARKQPRLATLVVVLFVILGFWLLHASLAQIPDGSGEPEDGTINAPAKSVTDGDASSGKAVQFGQTGPDGGVLTAAKFMDSYGVNTHLYQNKQPWANYDRIKSSLQELGVKNVRDAVKLDRQDVEDEYADLAASGMKVCTTIDQNTTTQADIDKAVAFAGRLRTALSCMSGINEFNKNGGQWWIELRNIQTMLYSGMKSKPATSSIPVLAPPITNQEDPQKLGDISSISDYGNIHNYLHGEPPEDELSGGLPRAFINVANKPAWLTETGYTDYKPTIEMVGSVSQRASAIYYPRTILEAYRLGITKTFIYLLIDEPVGGAVSERESGRGLLNEDWSPKPSFTALKNLNTLLADNNTSFSGTDLPYTLDGSDADTHNMVLAKSDGSYFLCIWQAVAVWNKVEKRDTNPPSKPVTVTFQRSMNKIESFQPNTSPDALSVANNVSTLTVDSSAKVLILKITP